MAAPHPHDPCPAAPEAAAPSPQAVPAPATAAPAAPQSPAVSAQALVTHGTSGACEDGWTGNSCALCGGATENGGNGACITYTSSPYATCSASLAWAPNSVRKSWSCELDQGDAIAALIEPGSMVVQCRTGLQPGGSEELAAAAAPAPAPGAEVVVPPPAAPAPAAEAPSAPAVPAPEAAAPVPAAAAPAPAAAPGNASGNPLAEAVAGIAGAIGGRRRLQQAAGGAARGCTIAFRVKSPQVAVQCEASDCIMNPGTSFVQCKQTACACPDDAACGNGASGRRSPPPSFLAEIRLRTDEAWRTRLHRRAGSRPAPLLPPACPAELIRALIGSVTTARLDCDPAGACKIELGGLPVAFLAASCQAAECLVPTNATLESTEGAQPACMPVDPAVAGARRRRRRRRRQRQQQQPC